VFIVDIGMLLTFKLPKDNHGVVSADFTGNIMRIIASNTGNEGALPLNFLFLSAGTGLMSRIARVCRAVDGMIFRAIGQHCTFRKTCIQTDNYRCRGRRIL
jgi:hypothetical protein